jgi:folate-dependent phosphoribosylglycinamide formyltransferase PurN
MLSDFLHVAVLSSLRAPGLNGVLHHPFRRSLYEVDCVITRCPPRDKTAREAFDRETAQILESYRVDTVVLLGYLYIITKPLLDAFPGRIFNVHDGLPAYPGLHATRDAILAGERETHSIVHEVTEQLDAGPLVVQSGPFPVAPFAQDAVLAGEMDIVRAYAYAHREWMMRSSWGDLVVRALEEVAAREEAVV